MNHPPISRTRYLQENRKMRFEEAYDSWTQGRITQSEAALLLPPQPAMMNSQYS